MSKYLIIGDVHAVEKELSDCQALLGYIYDIVKETGAKPVFMGDIYDSHAIIRLEVQKFWHDNLERLKPFGTIIITGNHDISNNKSSTASALSAHVHQAKIALPLQPFVEGNIAFIPYYHDRDLLVKEAKRLGTSYALMHQSVTGAKFENGFYDPSGIDQELFTQEKIISGHIHIEQVVGKVLYVGAPRWRSVSDAEQAERHLYLVNDDLEFIAKYPTSTVCSVLHKLEDNQDKPLTPIQYNPKDRYIVDIIGDKQFILERKNLYPNARVRVYESNKNKSAILSQKDPLPLSVQKWAATFRPKYSTDIDFQINIKKDFFFGQYFNQCSDDDD